MTIFCLRPFVNPGPGVHFVIKQSKTMQAMKDFRVAQLPSLQDLVVLALKKLIKKLKLQPSQPLFSYIQNDQLIPLTASKARFLLSDAVCKCGLSPKDFGFHAFHRSGASLAFDLQIPLENIKSHGHWKSEAVWKYLTWWWSLPFNKNYSPTDSTSLAWHISFSSVLYN